MLKRTCSLHQLAYVCLAILISSSINTPNAVAETPEKFPLELDHVFVWVTKGAPEAAALQRAGLHLQPETHPHTGQGTASKIFLFENLYLELIWIDDEPAAAKNMARSGIDMLQRSRWRETGASPFGVGLHRVGGVEVHIPFPITRYWAEWMQPNTIIEFAQSTSNLSEPMYFVLPAYLSINTPPMNQVLIERASSNRHSLGVSRLTNLKIETTSKKLTSTSEQLNRGGVLKVARAKEPLAELTFDDGKQKKRVDLRPELPIVLRY